MTLATVVYAASSAVSMDLSRGDAPADRSFSAEAGSARYSASRRFIPCSRIFTSAALAGRDVASRNAHASLSAGDAPPSFTMRSANFREVSIYISSFSSSSACSGVELICRCTTQDSRVGASKMVIEGGGTVRFQ